MAALTDALDGLTALLDGAGVTAAVDENDVVVPGAWLDVVGPSWPTLQGTRWRVNVLLIAGGGSTGPALGELADLLDRVVPAVITPDDVVQFVTTSLPADPSTPLPALLIPLDLDL